jgi:hypothetical protein
MLKIPLTETLYTTIDDADLALVSGFSWRPLTPPNAKTAYVHAWNNQQSYYMHRLITGVGPKLQVDHADLNGLNNCRYNLRSATRSQNQSNRGKQVNGITSHFKGVYWEPARSKWTVTIHYDKKTRYLGRYIDEIEAAKAYDEAALEVFGFYARLNFPTLNGVICIRHQMNVPDAFCAC